MLTGRNVRSIDKQAHRQILLRFHAKGDGITSD